MTPIKVEASLVYIEAIQCHPGSLGGEVLIFNIFEKRKSAKYVFFFFFAKSAMYVFVSEKKRNWILERWELIKIGVRNSRINLISSRVFNRWIVTAGDRKLCVEENRDKTLLLLLLLFWRKIKHYSFKWLYYQTSNTIITRHISPD